MYDQQIQKRDELEKQLKQFISKRLERESQHLKLLGQSFNLKVLNQQIKQNKQTVTQLRSRMSQLITNNVATFKAELKNKIENLNNLSPTNVMLRGYAIVNKDENVVTSTHNLKENDKISLTMKDGKIDAIVEKVRWKDCLLYTSDAADE